MFRSSVLVHPVQSTVCAERLRVSSDLCSRCAHAKPPGETCNTRTKAHTHERVPVCVPAADGELDC